MFNKILHTVLIIFLVGFVFFFFVALIQIWVFLLIPAMGKHIRL